MARKKVSIEHERRLKCRCAPMVTTDQRGIVGLLENGAVGSADTTPDASYDVHVHLLRHHQPLNVARRQLRLRYLHTHTRTHTHELNRIIIIIINRFV